MIILDLVEPSLSDINQRSFYFLILPDSSSGLFVVIRPTSQLSSLSLQCCVAIGFASQSIPGMKAFQFGLEMRFFLLISKGSFVRSSDMKVSKKSSKKKMSENAKSCLFFNVNLCTIF